MGNTGSQDSTAKKNKRKSQWTHNKYVEANNELQTDPQGEVTRAGSKEWKTKKNRKSFWIGRNKEIDKELQNECLNDEQKDASVATSPRKPEPQNAL